LMARNRPPFGGLALGRPSSVMNAVTRASVNYFDFRATR
jgi:hypothetical protein